MKKILHVITGLDVGGAETMLYRLVTGMDANRFESRVISLIKPGPMGEKLTKAGITVDSLDMRRGAPSPTGLLKLIKLMRTWRPDLMQSWLYHADLAGLIATKLAFPLGKGPKTAWNIRCSFMALEEYRRMTGITLGMCAALSNWPDMVLTNSEEARRFHKELGYTPKRFEVIPNGFDVDRFAPNNETRAEVREELSIGEESVVIGHVARFDAMKDHHTLLKAAALAAKECNAIFVLAGRGIDYDNLDLVTWIAEVGLASDRVRLLGEQSDVARLMTAMDIHVSSSTGESFPNVVGEAMSCGIPNVVTDVGDSKSLVGDTGTVVSPGKPETLGKELARMANMTLQKRKALGELARQRIMEQYSLPHIIKRYEAVYDELTN